MKISLLALAFATAAPAHAQAPAALPDTDPAMWVVKDKDTTVYLFGTFHGLDGKTDWFNDEVKAAFDKSSEVYVEAILPENPAEMQPLVMKYAVDPSGKTLTSKLPAQTKAKYQAALAKLGMPAQALDPVEPWFASLSLVGIAGQKLGLKAEHGADMVIKKAAKAAGKKVGELEGAEFQLALFDKMPEPQQVKQLDATLSAFDEMGPYLKNMMDTWNKGDEAGIAKLTAESLEQDPELYKLVFADRNATWADWIAKRMDQPGTVFVAVGAGHLAGKESVQDYLGKRGIKSERVKN
jgi:uncharacterized protein YbaP (TraB family)